MISIGRSNKIVVNDVSFVEEVANVLVPDSITFDAVHGNAEDASNRQMVEHTELPYVLRAQDSQPYRTVSTGIVKKIRRLVDTSTALLRKKHVRARTCCVALWMRKKHDVLIIYEVERNDAT